MFLHSPIADARPHGNDRIALICGRVPPLPGSSSAHKMEQNEPSFCRPPINADPANHGIPRSRLMQNQLNLSLAIDFPYRATICKSRGANELRKHLRPHTKTKCINPRAPEVFVRRLQKTERTKWQQGRSVWIRLTASAVQAALLAPCPVPSPVAFERSSRKVEDDCQPKVAFRRRLAHRASSIRPRGFRLPLTDYHPRALLRIRLGLLDQLADQPRDIAFAEQQEAKVCRQRALIRPAEVDLGRLSSF